jgi:hypothetical protein
MHEPGSSGADPWQGMQSAQLLAMQAWRNQLLECITSVICTCHLLHASSSAQDWSCCGYVLQVGTGLCVSFHHR